MKQFPENINDIGSFYKKGFESSSVVAPDIFANIQSELDTPKSSLGKGKVWGIVGTLVVLTSSLLFLMNQNEDPQEESQVIQVIEKKNPHKESASASIITTIDKVETPANVIKKDGGHVSLSLDIAQPKGQGIQENESKPKIVDSRDKEGLVIGNELRNEPLDLGKKVVPEEKPKENIITKIKKKKENVQPTIESEKTDNSKLIDGLIEDELFED